MLDATQEGLSVPRNNEETLFLVTAIDFAMGKMLGAYHTSAPRLRLVNNIPRNTPERLLH